MKFIGFCVILTVIAPFYILVCIFITTPTFLLDKSYKYRAMEDNEKAMMDNKILHLLSKPIVCFFEHYK